MDEYIQQLLTDASMPDTMDQAERDRLAAELSERAGDLMNRRIIDAMSDEAVATFQKLIEDQPDNVEALQQFIIDNVPNREEVAAQALLEFRALYLGSAA